jgi:hypothetical protein
VRMRKLPFVNCSSERWMCVVLCLVCLFVCFSFFFLFALALHLDSVGVYSVRQINKFIIVIIIVNVCGNNFAL